MKTGWRGWVLVAAAVAAGCSSAPGRAPLTPGPQPPAQILLVQVAQAGNAVRRVALEDYVRAAVISELAPPSGDAAVMAAMFEVQAIVARTYALSNRGRHQREGFDVCSTTHCQLYEPGRLKTSRWAAPATEAVRRTAGAVLWHGTAPAAAVFHADCGGHTRSSVSAWGGTARSYLQGLPDDDPAAAAHAQWTYQVTVAEMVAALNADARTRIGSGLDTIRVLDRDMSGRAQTIALHGRRERLVKGEDFRAVLSRRFGAGAVRSTLFDVRREGRAFVFEGRGFGHGVGLCQAGALARIRAGARPAEVLRRYYPGTTLRSAR